MRVKLHAVRGSVPVFAAAAVMMTRCSGSAQSLCSLDGTGVADVRSDSFPNRPPTSRQLPAAAASCLTSSSTCGLLCRTGTPVQTFNCIRVGVEVQHVGCATCWVCKRDTSATPRHMLGVQYVGRATCRVCKREALSAHRPPPLTCIAASASGGGCRSEEPTLRSSTVWPAAWAAALATSISKNAP